jgi:hypothetical protein
MPFDVMHCILQNNARSILLFWHGDRDAAITDKHIRNEGQKKKLSTMLANSRREIPSKLGTLFTSWGSYRLFKADELRSILTLYGTALLDGLIPEPELANFELLAEIWSISTQYSISSDDLSTLRQKIIDFVTGYQQLYYRNEPARLPTCLINIHSLLHLVQCIEDNGPARYWWSFPTERFCGLIKSLVRDHHTFPQ